MNWIKYLLSYLFPTTIYTKNSAVSKKIEITYNYGKLVLDSAHTNYSYGSLQKILRRGLKKIGFQKISAMEKILVLGVAGGSVVKTLVDEIGFKGKIIGVEIDQEIIEIANKYFKLNEIKNLEIKIDDAFQFVLKTKDKYDLIIIDIFEDTKMPNFLFEQFFIQRIGNILNKNGCFLFNTMILNQKDQNRNNDFLEVIENQIFKIEKISNVENFNELIIGYKI